MKVSEQELAIITRTVIEYLENEKQKQENAKQDTRLRNIKLLLKNYRALVLHCEKIQGDLIKFEDTSIQDLDIDTISLESIESIKQSKRKSLALIYFVKGKTEAYKSSCSTDELKYFRVLEMKYLTPKKYTVQEIAKIENIDRTTVTRYLDKAISQLPVIFFGAEAIKFE